MLDRLAELQKINDELTTLIEQRKNLQSLNEQVRLLKQQKHILLEELWKEDEAPIKDIAQALRCTPDRAYDYIYQSRWFQTKRQIRKETK